jgi:hypothetical protein
MQLGIEKKGGGAHRLEVFKGAQLAGVVLAT